MTVAEINILQTRIPAMHTLFCSLTGEQWPYDTRKHARWERWLVKFNEQNLKDVIAWIHRQPWKSEWKRSAMSYNKLIQDLDNFADRLAESQSDQRASESRKRRPAMDRNRAEVLRDLGHSDDTPLVHTKSAKEALSKAFEKLKAAVDNTEAL